MAAIDAPALKTAKSEIFTAFPDHKGWYINPTTGKKEYVTGIGGDDAHQRRKSDHNQGNAIDIHHEPENGTDGNKIAAIAIRDPRIAYVIWNRRIYTPGKGWKLYSKHRKMPHDTHVHVSIKPAARGDTSPWNWDQPDPGINKLQCTKAAPQGEGKFEDVVIPPPPPPPKKKKKKGRQAADATSKSGRFRLVQGYHGVLLESSYNMAAHVETPHTGGGQIEKASQTVFLGPEQRGFARIGDPTNDGYGVVEGVHSVLVG